MACVKCCHGRLAHGLLLLWLEPQGCVSDVRVRRLESLSINRDSFEMSWQRQRMNSSREPYDSENLGVGLLTGAAVCP